MSYIVLCFIFVVFALTNLITLIKLYIVNLNPSNVDTIDNFVSFLSKCNLVLGIGCLLRSYAVLLLFKNPYPLNKVDLMYLLCAFESLMLGYGIISEYWRIKLSIFNHVKTLDKLRTIK